MIANNADNVGRLRALMHSITSAPKVRCSRSKLFPRAHGSITIYQHGGHNGSPTVYETTALYL